MYTVKSVFEKEAREFFAKLVAEVKEEKQHSKG